MKKILFIPFLLSTLSKMKSEAKESLCDRPVISAADRMANNTVRLYRGPYYWLLKGLPADVGSLEGPFEIPFEGMAPINRNNSVVTLLGGTDRGNTVKTEDKSYWMWDQNGRLKTKKEGIIHNRFPTGGFDAVIHDGNLDDPTLIGFKGIKTYYLSTRYRVWTIDNKPSGHMGGKYKENFPTDVTAAFSMAAPDPSDGYIVYFFQKDKFCKRTKILESGQQCDQWLPSRQLFGCGALNATKFEGQYQQNNSQTDVNSETQEKVKPKSNIEERKACVTVTVAMVLLILQITVTLLK